LSGMGYIDSDSRVCDLLKTAMVEQSLSMRRLSKLTGFSTSTISRIMSGQQVASIHHFQAFSKHLKIPIDQLLQTAGVLDGRQLHSELVFLFHTIEDILNAFDIDLYTVIAQIQKQLLVYEQYAGTEEGQALVREGFPAKLQAMNGAGTVIDKLSLLYERFCDDCTDQNERSVIGSALLYFTVSTDVIPDYLFPIGYLDDAIAINMVLERLAQLHTSDVQEEALS